MASATRFLHQGCIVLIHKLEKRCFIFIIQNENNCVYIAYNSPKMNIDCNQEYEAKEKTFPEQVTQIIQTS